MLSEMLSLETHKIEKGQRTYVLCFFSQILLHLQKKRDIMVYTSL